MIDITKYLPAFAGLEADLKQALIDQDEAAKALKAAEAAYSTATEIVGNLNFVTEILRKFQAAAPVSATPTN